jgi:glycogen debranching enzyme
VISTEGRHHEHVTTGRRSPGTATAPIGYHTGTIWPHDNALIVAGLIRYGFRDEANKIALAQFEAAAFSDFRLPEAFAGFFLSSWPCA